MRRTVILIAGIIAQGAPGVTELVYEAAGPCGGNTLPSWKPRQTACVCAPALPTAADSISVAVVGGHRNWYSVHGGTVRDRGDTVYLEVRMERLGEGVVVGFLESPWEVSACVPPRGAGELTIVGRLLVEEADASMDTEEVIRRVGIVASTGGSSCLETGWRGRDANDRVVPYVLPGNEAVMEIRDTEGWLGDPAVLSIGFDPSLVQVAGDQIGTASGCTGTLELPEPGRATVSLECDGQVADTALAWLTVTAGDEFTDWADVVLETVACGGITEMPESILRMSAMPGRTASPADLNGDGFVGANDFFFFADCFGGTDPSCDFDADGTVGFDDFFIFADYFSEAVAQW